MVVIVGRPVKAHCHGRPEHDEWHMLCKIHSLLGIPAVDIDISFSILRLEILWSNCHLLTTSHYCKHKDLHVNAITKS